LCHLRPCSRYRGGCEQDEYGQDQTRKHLPPSFCLDFERGKCAAGGSRTVAPSPHQTTAMLFSTSVTPGAPHAVRPATTRSWIEWTVPSRRTFPPSALTRIVFGSKNHERCKACMMSSGHHTCAGRDADMGRGYAGLPRQLSKHGVLQVSIVTHYSSPDIFCCGRSSDVCGDCVSLRLGRCFQPTWICADPPSVSQKRSNTDYAVAHIGARRDSRGRRGAF
jgi:hypothetical protein